MSAAGSNTNKAYQDDNYFDNAILMQLNEIAFNTGLINESTKQKIMLQIQKKL